jgi:hypothetical protein
MPKELTPKSAPFGQKSKKNGQGLRPICSLFLPRFPDLRQRKISLTFAFPDFKEPPKFAAGPPKIPEEPPYFPKGPPCFPEEPPYSPEELPRFCMPKQQEKPQL